MCVIMRVHYVLMHNTRVRVNVVVMELNSVLNTCKQ